MPQTSLEDIEKIRIYKFYIEKYNRHPLFILIILILIYSMLFLFNIKYKINIFNIKIDIKLLIELIVLIIWFLHKYLYIFSRRYLKNTTLIVFRIVDSDVLKYEILKDKLFTKLKDNLSGNIKIILLYDKKNRSNEELKKLNKILKATMIFDICEKNGNIDGENTYILQIKQDIFELDFYNNEKINELFKKELISAINNYFKLTDKNSLIDVNDSEFILEAGIRYIVSIIYIINKRIYFAYDETKKVSNLLEMNISTESKNINYIRDNLPMRYIDFYFCIYNEEYLKKHIKNISIEQLIKIDKYYDDYLLKLNSIKSKISKYEYEFHLYNYYVVKATITYEISGTDEAMKIVDEWYNKNIDISYLHRLDKAYLTAIKGDYIESIKIYKRIFKTKTISKIDYNSIIDFINQHIDIKENYISNLFCKTVLSFLYQDWSCYNKTIKLLKESNINLYNLLNEKL